MNTLHVLTATLRRRLSHFTTQTNELKLALKQIEAAIAALSKEATPPTGNQMQDTCNQIDYLELYNKLPTRARKTLVKLKIADSASFARLTVFELQCAPNCGPRTVRTIVETFAGYGITLPRGY